jgi:hypothetical protein
MSAYWVLGVCLLGLRGVVIVVCKVVGLVMFRIVIFYCVGV